jgi:hypothetical protein
LIYLGVQLDSLLNTEAVLFLGWCSIVYEREDDLVVYLGGFLVRVGVALLFQRNWCDEVGLQNLDHVVLLTGTDDMILASADDMTKCLFAVLYISFWG